MGSMSLSRRALGLAGLGALVLPSAARAQAATPSGTVSQFADALLEAMKAGQAGAPFAQRAATLASAIERTFDLETILRVSVGPQWNSLPPDQQQALRGAFRRYTIANFTANFDSYGGENIQVNPEPRSLPNGDEIITMTLGKPGDPSPTTLGYVMRQTPAGWKAVDVLADGYISRVATQRSDFRSLLMNGGAPALVSSLESKAAGLAG